MAKLVLGTDINNTGTASFIRDVSPKYYVEKTVDANGKLVGSNVIINLSGATDVGDYVLEHSYYMVTFPANTTLDFSSLITLSGERAFYYMFSNSSNLTHVDLSSLQVISGTYASYYMFNNCSTIISFDLSSLQTISGTQGCQSTFYDCTGLTNANLSSLITISGSNGCKQMFLGCTNLVNVDLSSLQTISGSSACSSMFSGCISLKNVVFDSLTTISGSSACSQMFYNCTSLISISFPSLKSNSVTATNAFNTMLRGVIGCTLHFPSNLESTIQTLTGYPNFGGTNTSIVFDLSATE